MYIPTNQILENQYTSGGEFIEKTTMKNYAGYYYKLGDKFYVGKSFSPSASELTKSTSNNNQLLNNSTSLGSQFLSKQKNLSQFITNTINSTTFKPTQKDYQNGVVKRYFVKQNNIIKEVNENVYKETLVNPIIQKVFINWNINGKNNINEINQADKVMVGLKAFLES